MAKLRALAFLVIGILFLTRGSYLYNNLFEDDVSQTMELNITQRKNVLLLIVDDMRAEAAPFIDDEERPWLNSEVRTPHLDSLASRSLVLRRAYAQLAWCNPSRSSFLTSRRPDTTHVINNYQFFRSKRSPNMTTMPQYFLQQGYTTVGVGKIFHSRRESPYLVDEGISWSEPFVKVERFHIRGRRKSWMAVSEEDRKAEPLRDERLRDIAIQKLKERTTAYRSGGKPFFLAVGFHKPHLPLVCPQQYFDMYSLDKIHLAENNFWPSGVPDVAFSKSRELRDFNNMRKYNKDWSFNVTLPTQAASELRRAYYSCVSYSDHLIGDVLHKLEELDMVKDTVIAFLGDHGWHLGEHSIWGKNSNFEEAAHAPVMLSIPGLTDYGIVSDNLVELVDLFPTLAEAAGVPPPPLCPQRNSEDVPLCTEGTSWLPLINTPNTKQWKSHVYSQYPWPDYNNIDHPTYMGYSIRTTRYRYNEWVNFTWGFPTEWTKPHAVELYDLKKDPRQIHNRARDPNYAEEIEELSEMLHSGWHGALPKQ